MFSSLCSVLLSGCANRAATLPQVQAIHEEPVRFSNGEVNLSGTLVLPDGQQRHPAVVLFHGSGPQARDLFTARWFAQQGFAALAYDKRGVGESTGSWRSVPFMQLADDGLAAIALLKSRADIDPRHIGVWGLSQGGWLGPLAASHSADISFVIAVSGPGVSPGAQMLVYYANELRDRGVPESDVLEATALRRDVWDYMSSGDGYKKARDEMASARRKPWFKEVAAQQDNLFEELPPPAERLTPHGRSLLWFGQEMNYDPVVALRALRVPALFLFGDADHTIPVDESVTIIRRVQAEDAAAGVHQDITVREFPGVYHAMEKQMTPGEREVAPEYLAAMQKWLASRVHPD